MVPFLLDGMKSVFSIVSSYIERSHNQTQIQYCVCCVIRNIKWETVPQKPLWTEGLFMVGYDSFSFMDA